jgi:hypothetical protein
MAKDTFANTHPGCSTFAFADPIKRALMVMFDFSVRQLWGPDKDKIDPRWGISPREAMTKFGTELMQGWMGSDFWVRVLENQLDTEKINSPIVMITDVRFPLEVEMIKRRGGYLVEIVRPNLDTSYRDQKTLNHISEQLQVEADFVVINDKDLDHPYNEAQRIIKAIKESKSD